MILYCKFIPTIVISEPDDVTVCEGVGAEFTCVLDGSIRVEDIQWYRYIMDTGATEMVDSDLESIDISFSAIRNMNSTLTVTGTRKSHTGYYWVGTPSFNVCNASLTVLASMFVNIIHYDYDYVYIIMYVHICIARIFILNFY